MSAGPRAGADRQSTGTPFIPFLTGCEAAVLHGAAFAAGSGGLVGLLIEGRLTHAHLKWEDPLSPYGV